MPPAQQAVVRTILMENHDAAYQVWRETGLRRRVLVHIDAHHDMWWVPDGDTVTIANFICPALKEDMVREVFWVVPDAAWETPRSRRPILRHVRAIVKGYPGHSPRLQIDHKQITAAVLGKYLHVLPLANLPRIEEKVLLDIDVDYLVIPCVTRGGFDRHAPVPWCWPAELLARLRDLGTASEIVTIVYSVEGGYTPLKWKYLGDELALRLGKSDPDDAAVQGMDLMRQGALAAERQEVAAAEGFYQQATTLLPDSAAPCYHLAHLYLQAGREDAARELYSTALARDPSYRTAYNNAGVCYYWERRFAEARQEHQRTLMLDPRDAYAHLGLGQLALREKRWSEAEASLRTALGFDKMLPDGWRALGTVLAKQKRHGEAILAYQESLKVVLHGHKPLTQAIITQPPGELLTDADHFAIHTRLARLYQATGAIPQAITGYRLGIAGGEDGPIIRFSLMRLYLRQKHWRLAAQQSWPGVKAACVGTWTTGRWAFREMWRAFWRLIETYWCGNIR
jgi:tetratricopeptide (TPR) repeat protein